MLSYRLQQVADFVSKCKTVADIGTDHGYIPIWLIKNKICCYAIAGDVSRGSCDKAEKNISMHGLNDHISVRCGNGLEIIDKTDAVDCIIISGMGGLLTVDILKSNIDVFNNAKQLVMQPQKDIDRVREFIIANGFKITAEKMLKENDKYYTVINAYRGASEKYSKKELMFGKFLPAEKSLVFKEYVECEMNKIINALNSLKNNPQHKQRYEELYEKSTIYKEVFECL